MLSVDCCKHYEKTPWKSHGDFPKGYRERIEIGVELRGKRRRDFSSPPHLPGGAATLHGAYSLGVLVIYADGWIWRISAFKRAPYVVETNAVNGTWLSLLAKLFMSQISFFLGIKFNLPEGLFFCNESAT